ncbi:MAG: DUF4244 domain-containing protein [Sporichthyaceae bacterium]
MDREDVDQRTGMPAVNDAGMSTVEYALGTLAAAGFAAVLMKVLTSGAVEGLLARLVERALSGAM